MAAGLAKKLDEFLNSKEDEMYHRLRNKDIIFDNNLSNKFNDKKSTLLRTKRREIMKFFERDDSRKSTLRSRINLASTKEERECSTNFKDLRYANILVQFYYKTI